MRWGLYDMHGYLWEFVSDGWHDTYAQAPADGTSWASSEQPPRRVIRGGSWKDRHESLRSAHRRPIAEDAQDDAVGLRCVKAKAKVTHPGGLNFPRSLPMPRHSVHLPCAIGWSLVHRIR